MSLSKFFESGYKGGGNNENSFNKEGGFEDADRAGEIRDKVVAKAVLACRKVETGEILSDDEAELFEKFQAGEFDEPKLSDDVLRRWENLN